MSEPTDIEEAKEGKKKSKKKLLALPIVILLVAGVGYKMFLAPKPVPPKKKIEGHVLPLDKEFVVNLADGHYGKLSVAIVVDESSIPADHGSGPIVLPQNAVIRAIVTDELTGIDQAELVEREPRAELAETILKRIEKETDEKVHEVLFTDIAVQ